MAEKNDLQKLLTTLGMKSGIIPCVGTVEPLRQEAGKRPGCDRQLHVDKLQHKSSEVLQQVTSLHSDLLLTYKTTGPVSYGTSVRTGLFYI